MPRKFMVILPEELIKRVRWAVKDIRRLIMPARVPHFLYHYTREKGFNGIVERRALWASCAANLEDESEITHGAEILAGIIEHRLAHQITLRNFTKLVLARLKSKPLERKEKTYVACFCERGNFESQWESYPYCLRFPTYRDGTPGLRARTSRASIQFVKATYKNQRKESSLITLVDRVIEALEDQTIVDWDGDGHLARSIADPVAFWISELALDVLVSFKSDKFQCEHEWRLVIRPSQMLPGSDRLLPDQAFETMVITDDNGKRHIELFAQAPDSVLVRSGRPPVPFDSVTIGTFGEAEPLRVRAQRLLEDGCFEDIPVHLSKPKWWSRVPWVAK